MTRATSIISAYKCQDWLTGRITNLLDQTEVPNIVAVCQKDSKEAEILSKFPEVTTITTPDIPTLYRAWNMALDAVETKYINIANSDDRLSNFAIKEMCDELDNDPEAGLVYANCDVVRELNGESVEVIDWMEGDLFKGCFIGPFPTYRKKLHELYGEYPSDYVVSGDYYFFLNLYRNGVKLKHIKKTMGRWWDRSHNPELPTNLEFRQKNRATWEAARAKEFWRNK